MCTCIIYIDNYLDHFPRIFRGVGDFWISNILLIVRSLRFISVLIFQNVEPDDVDTTKMYDERFNVFHGNPVFGHTRPNRGKMLRLFYLGE